MYSKSIPFVSLLVFSSVVAGFNCSIPPIYVDIHKRIVHGTDTFQYGSFIGAGTPAQNQSLWPSLSQNETTVAASDFCDRSKLADCTRSTRGNIALAESSTWRENAQYKSSDLLSIANTSLFGTDTLSLYTHFFETDPARSTPLQNFTFEVATSGDTSPGILGLGQTSTVLQKLFNDGIIAGHTFSLYVGTGMDRAGGVINGSTTFGGYDAGRFEGPVHDYAMSLDQTSPLKVTVKDIILDDPGTDIRNISLFSSAVFPDLSSGDFPPFEARITTDQYPLSLPFELTQNFANLLQAKASDHPDGSLAMGSGFNGTMTIVLSDGFSVNLPPSIVRNASSLTPIAARQRSDNRPFLLSTAFLTQVYLMINYDEYKFHLAKAVVEQEYVVPVTFCPRTGAPVPFVKKGKNFWSLGLIGAVLGGIIGGLAVFTLSGCLYVLWRRKRAARVHEEAMRASAKMEQFYEEEQGRRTGKSRFARLWPWWTGGR